MIRHFFLFISIFAFLISAAQEWSGQWTIYPIIGSKYDKITDTGSKVYFLSSGSLYSFDRSSSETYFYNKSNKLSSSNINNIYHNPDGKYILVVYADNTIDMISEDGRVYCLPEIKDANINTEKEIIDVAFGKGCFAVATNFGLVIYNDSKREVMQSGNYRTPIDAIAICGDNILINVSGQLKTAKFSDRLNSLSAFSDVAGMSAEKMYGISDNKIVWNRKGNNQLNISTIDFNTKNISTETTGIKVESDFDRWSGGIYFRSGNNVVMYDLTGVKTDQFMLNETLKSNVVGMWEGKKSVWLGGNQGAAQFDMSSSTPTVISDWYRPESGTCAEVAYFYLSPDGERIYVSNLGSTICRIYLPHLTSDSDGIKFRQTTDIIENGQLRDVSLTEASAGTSNVKEQQVLNGDKAMYGGAARLAEDPTDPDTYFIGNTLEGLYVVKDRKEVWKFDITNSPFYTYWNTRVYDVNFDPQGNLWVGHAHNTANYGPYVVLPAAKLRKGFDKITKSDWVWPNISDFDPFSKDFISLFCKKSNYAFFINGNGYKGFYVLDTKGTYDNMIDDVCRNFGVVSDQDGNTLQTEYYFAMTEDRQGRVWFGTTQGVFYINAASEINENTNIVRPKVPRNDGTNYADYLLDSEQINSIAVDPSNRKWMATDYSGVYLVSENGDRIISHFDTSNSPLPSNRVTSVVCDPLSNTVYFGTTEGLLSYKSDSSPANEDFSEVYAYPNPVRPDYTGWITIAGLMDDSLVKITDSAGNVLYQGRSEGGMLLWDGCNSSGERVRTGIYYVYASSGGDGQSTSGAVTKIMVVK